MRPSRSPVDSPGASPSPSGVRRAAFVLGGLALAALVRLWIVPLGSSLSLDEFGTWWASDGGLGEILSRARLFPQSVPYVAIVWLERALGGSGEISLRLPSLLAAGLAAYCLYRLGAELVDRETGLLAAGIFVGFRPIAFAAGDARPYAFAVLAATGAFWMLVRWLDRGRAADAVGYALLATAAVYFQYLFATMFLVHAAYAVRRWRRGGAVSARSVSCVAVAIAVLSAPAALWVLAIARDRAAHAFAAMPDGEALVSSLVPAEVLAALSASLGVGWLLGLVGGRPQGPIWSRPVPQGDAGRVPPADALWLLALWALLPAPVLFVASRTTGTSLFVSRYMLWMIPGQALLMAWALRGLRPVRSRLAVVAGYLILMALARGQNVMHTNEDWRGAVAAMNAVNGNHPALLSGTYTESRTLDWLRSGKHADYMRAPLDYYPAAGPAILLPLNFGPEAEAHVEDLIRSQLASSDRFVLIERSSRFASWAPWILERVRHAYRVRRVWNGYPNVWVFERSAGPA
jgi:Dolichyl-phosphate-mannose-protein mannosyltransferase